MPGGRGSGGPGGPGGRGPGGRGPGPGGFHGAPPPPHRGWRRGGYGCGSFLFCFLLVIGIGIFGMNSLFF